jgi:hypothetical protein
LCPISTENNCGLKLGRIEGLANLRDFERGRGHEYLKFSGTECDLCVGEVALGLAFSGLRISDQREFFHRAFSDWQKTTVILIIVRKRGRAGEQAKNAGSCSSSC